MAGCGSQAQSVHKMSERVYPLPFLVEVIENIEVRFQENVTVKKTKEIEVAHFGNFSSRGAESVAVIYVES